MNAKQPLVSVITPCYNSGKFIAKTIESVLSQSYQNWEMILIDDSSIDNTVEVVKEFIKNDKRIKLIQLQVNSGAAIARNTGIKNAEGKYIAFVDSDDRWHTEKLQVQINLMEKNNWSLTYTDYYVCWENQESQPFAALRDVVSYKDVVRFNYLACSTVVFSADKLGKHYMPDIRSRQDWGLWIKLLQQGGKAYRVKEKLMYYMVRDNSISDNKKKQIKYHWYIYRKFLRFNLIYALIMFSQNIIRHAVNLRK